jgi:coenzyme F420-reducing hydrogenase beta subunit
MARLRVGILSMQRILNYGSFLQAYGLRGILESLGCDVQFVDYRPGRCLVEPEGGGKSGLARKVGKALEALGYDVPLRDKLAFIQYKRTYAQRFYPMLGLTEEPNLAPDIDLLVIGSDEVFNCVQDNPNVGYTPALFGEGIRAGRKVSYAASFGNTTLARLDEYGKRGEVAGWLREFDAISVRDANSGAVVSELTGVEPVYNLDPVLAYDFMGECDEIPTSVDEAAPYMIVYGYSGRLSKEECIAVRAYADGRGLKVLNVGGVQGVCDRFVDCSPFEVIAYFAHAEAVVTDTFHGTILSVITRTPFASFVRDQSYGNSQKLGDLLRRLGLEGRVAGGADALAGVFGVPVAWDAVDTVIAEGRAAARSYLAGQVGLCREERPAPRASYLNTGHATDCTGCGACAYVCPTGAITMTEDACGFVLPEVDEGACVHCRKCAGACHMNNPASLRCGAPVACYGAIENDRDSLRRSASGGVATVLSRRALGTGGVVYGCIADREDVHHKRLASAGDLTRVQGSKYVQSDIARAFGPLEGDLKAGRAVTFVGTPCQCAAVRKLFGDPDRLTTIDLVCEGVPSRRMYADFLDDLERERGERVTDFRFRDKRGGWSTKNALVLGEGGRQLEEQSHSYYYYYYWLFSKALILRGSCYECPYACGERVGDVTVGDLWGAETAELGYGLPDFEAGISCVLVSSERGEAMLADASSEMGLRPCAEGDISRANMALRHPSTCDLEERKAVLAAYAERGADGMRGEYERLFGPEERCRADVAANMPLPIRVLAKRAKSSLRGLI